ncbi:MAG: hypothetical protein MRY64_16045 [Hyphomonadaceae bacterium]|nr:hypothetical protein [Hyphomonadaceae bacterium]
MNSLRLAVGLAALALAGCQLPTPPPAALSFTPATACSERFQSAGATDLTPDAPTASIRRYFVVDTVAPCLVEAGQDLPYALFKLPTTGNPASANAGAIMAANRVFAAKIVTLDANLNEVRRFEHDVFLRRGSSLTHLFRPTDDEAYIAIMASPELVGGRYSMITGDLDSVTRTGQWERLFKDDEAYRNGLSSPYSYEGEVFVQVYFAEPETED